MRISRKFLLGIIAVSLLFGMLIVGCDDNKDSIETPVIFNGYYGVTDDGDTLEIIIKEGTAKNIAVTSRMVTWGANNTYEIKINGKVVSSGTAAKTGDNITFTPSDGSSVTVDGYTSGAPNITVSKGENTYKAKTVVAQDYYYAIGGPVNKTLAQLRNDFAGKTPEQIYNAYFYVSGYDYDAGTWDYICEFGKYYQCPDSELSRVAKEMNDGNISGVGYYTHKQYGNIVYYVSKISPGF